MTLGWSIFGYLLFMGLVLVVHEYGHFAAARFFKIKIARFSIGIGSIMWRKASPRSGEWALSSLPIGGYVKFATEADTGPVSDGLIFMDKAPAHARLVVILAGPAANILLAIVAFTAGMVVRDEAVAPVLGEPPAESYLHDAGVQGGDRVISINDRPILDYADISLHNVMSSLLVRTNHWVVERDGHLHEFLIPAPPVQVIPQRMLSATIGMSDPRRMSPPLIREVYDSENPLKPDDTIVEVDGVRVATITEMSDALRGKVGQKVRIIASRAGAEVELLVQVDQHPSRRIGEGALGIEVNLPPTQKIDYIGLGPTLVGEAFARCLDYSAISFAAVYHLASGHIGIDTFSGPAQIAHASGQAARKFVSTIDFAPLLTYIAVLSISIGAFNLLPIPVLDGGGAVIAVLEMVSRRRIPEKAAQFIQYTGLALLGMFFLAAFTSDYLWLINL